MIYTTVRICLMAWGGLLFFLIGRRLARSRWATLLAFLGLGLILLQYASPRWRFDWWLPMPIGVARDLIFLPGALLVGVAFGRRGTRSRSRILTLLLTILYALFLLHDPVFVLATAPGNLAEPSRVREGVVLQRNARNCVPASAATLLKLWGIPADGGRLAVRAQTSYYGTPSHRLLAALRARLRGTSLAPHRMRLTWDELAAIDLPCVLYVKLHRTIRHAVTLLGYDGERVSIGEPLKGRQEFDRSTFETIKPLTGTAIVIGPRLDGPFAPGAEHPALARIRSWFGLASTRRFDSKLEGCVRRFQLRKGLQPSGRLELKTLLALEAEYGARARPSLSSPLE